MNADALKTIAANSDIPRETFAAYVCDPESAERLAPVIAERGWSKDRIQMGGIANAIRAVSVLPSPLYLVIDLSESSDPIGDIHALADICEADTAVLALGLANDVKLFRQILQAGVHDYLLKPASTETLREAVAELILMTEQEQQQQVNLDTQKRAAFIGVRGGVGASTLALATATILAERYERDIMHLDMDIHFGGAALSLDMEPGRGLQEALENPGRIDDLFLARATLTEGEHLTILAAESPIQDDSRPSSEAFEQMIESVRESHEHLVIDMPRNALSMVGDGLAAITDFYLVTDLSLKATRDTIRIMAFIQKVSPDAKIHIIHNEVRTGDTELSQADFEASIERKIRYHIPFDNKAFLNAEKQSKSLYQSDHNSKISKLLVELAQNIIGVEKEDKQKSSFLSGIFKK